MTGLPMFSIRSKHVLAGERVLATAGRRLHRQLVDVRAGDERLLARAGHDDDADAFVLLEIEHRSTQLVERLRVQRVEHLRAVDRDDRRRPVALEQKIVEGHQSGNGYISQPSTTAEARKPPNISAPKRSCSRDIVFRDHREHERDEEREDRQQEQVALHYFLPMATS